MLNLKKIIVSGIAVSTLLLGIAGTAPATNFEVNIYGASAQYLYWNSQSANFLTSQKGCASTTYGETADKKNGMAYGSTCTGGHTYSIRYSAKASYDGISSLQGDGTYTAAADKCNAGDAVCLPIGGTVPAGQADFYRKMKSDSTSSGATQENKCCARINLGASDVAGGSFKQQSHGLLKGPLGGVQTDRVFNGVSAAGLTTYQPLIVPFGFFANNNVTHTVCTSPDPLTPSSSAHKAISTWGNQCWLGDAALNSGHSTDCIGYYKCINRLCSGGVNVGAACDEVTDCPDVTLANTSCERVPLDNVSRLMVTHIFKGQATFWSDFGQYYPAIPVVACMRHAGSGTHATFDILMKGNGWGQETPTQQSTSGPWYYFNDGAADEMNCIALSQLNAFGDGLTDVGAIGYADCDQLVGTKASGTSKFPYENVHALKLDGIECTRAKIRNGEYPFYSDSWNFWKSSDANASLISELMTFASNPANIPASKAGYWAAKAEMNFNKSSDTAWPAFVGGDGSQLP